MRVVVLQTAAHVEHYSKHQRKTDDLIIPIGPEAMFYSEKNGWETCSLGGLWTSEDYEQAKDESQAKIDSLIDALDAYSKNWNSDIGLEMGRYYGFQLYGYVGHLHYNYFIARSIAKRIRPDNVLVYTKDGDQGSLDLLPDPDCVLSDVLLRSGCFDTGHIEVQRICEKRKGRTVRERIVHALPLTLATRLREFRNKWRIWSRGKSTYRLLLVGGGYDWIKISQYQSFRGVFSLHVMPQVMGEGVAPPKDLIDILSSSVEFADMRVFNVEKLAAAIYADMILYAKKNEKLINQLKRYDAIVTAVLTTPWDNYLSHMAAKMNIPVVVWQHGEKGQSHDITVSYTELFYATDYLAYGAAVAKQYLSWVGKCRLVNVAAVGSLGKRVDWYGGASIVYATGKWFTTSVPFSVLPDPDSRLYRAHKTILNYLDNVAIGRSVTVKANNTPGANAIPYDYEHVRIDYSTPFSTLLKTAGVIILDAPATTLVESCSTNVPIFALGGRTNYHADFLDKVKRRVVWCETPDELVMKLDAYLCMGKYEADVNDDAYRREYCANSEPEEVILKVKQSLMKAIDRSRSAGER